MIRELHRTDIDHVAEIWLDTNIKAHCFISSRYWKNNFEAVKEQLSQAEVYVYEDESGIHGFIGLQDDYIAGIFVCYEFQSRGIGKQLLDYAKNIRQKLQLSVYQNNIRAVRFYQREGFELQHKGVDEDTKEIEYLMVWTQ